MNISDYVLRSLAFIILSFSLLHSYLLKMNMDEKEQHLQAHLYRIKHENDNFEKAGLNGAKILESYRNFAAKYLGNDIQLKDEYKYKVDYSLGTIEALKGEHQREKVVNTMIHDIFSYSDDFLDPSIFKKSMIDNRVHFGKFEELASPRQGKYDIYINDNKIPFNYSHEYVAACRDTMKFRVNMIKINPGSYDIDTTILSETWILNQNIK